MTLYNLLITLAVAAVATSIATPRFSDWIARYRATSTVNQFVGAVALARTVAMTQNQNTSLCPSDGQRCLARDEWHSGQLIFVDHNGDGQVDPSDVPVRYLPGWHHDARVRWAAFRARAYLQFTRRGYTNWQNGSFIYCPGNGDLRLARRLVINAAGRTYRAYDRNGDGVDTGPGNRPLRC